MPLVKVAELSALPSGSVTEVMTDGGVFAVCNVEGAVFCVEGTCPHAGGPLGQGTLNGGFLVCPWHGWEFDCRTGVNDFDEDVQLKTFPVSIENQQIMVDLPDQPASV
jgi:nitrite reductase (NADH) small subunit